MQKTHYSGELPAKMEVDKYKLVYRYNIKEVTRESGEIGEDSENSELSQTEYTAFETVIYAPFSQDKLIEKFFTEYFGNDYECKLLNEYNSALLDVYSEEEKTQKIERYKSFLTKRKAIKEEIETICRENGIS